MAKNINDSIKDLAINYLSESMSDFLNVIEDSDDINEFAFNSSKAMDTILKELEEKKDNLTTIEIDFTYMQFIVFNFASCVYLWINNNYKFDGVFYKYVFDNLDLATSMFKEVINNE